MYIARFGDRRWVSSRSGVYTFDGDALAPVASDDDGARSFQALDARHGLLWEEHIQFGAPWTCVV